MARKKEKRVVIDLEMDVHDSSTGTYHVEGPIVTLCEGGTVMFSDKGSGENFIFLYPEQVALLKTIIGLGDKITVEEREV